MAHQTGDRWLDPKAEAALKEIHGAAVVDALVENISDDIYDVLVVGLTRSAFGARPEIGAAFLQADLKRRRAEAAMVESEAEMFQTISGKLASAGKSPEAFSSIADAAAELIAALAGKNATMGDGDPSGGTPVPPEDPTVPTPPSGGSTTTPESCYDRYRRELSDLWRKKDLMPT